MAKRKSMKPKYLGMRASVLAVASCLAISGLPLEASAAGLGKIVVLSGLGQPLRAEIEVSATREELSDMKAQLASPDAFKQAGLDYATTLLGIRFKMEKRPNGVSVIRLTSDKPINDPFVDMLLELNWPAGRLVREYTFLLDPPEMAVKAAAPVASAIAKPVVSSKPRVEQQPTAAINDETRSRAAVKAQAQASAPATAQKQVAQSAGEQDAREVRRGETLNKIAIETKPEGVSLEQMLVGLLRANQDAFDGGNMNRLKAGRILSVPDRSALEAVSLGEAKKIVAAQSADWNAYRSKLAGIAAQTPVKEGDAKQEAAGKITAKVEDKAAPVEAPKDQLKVSKTESAAAKSGGVGKVSEEDRIAKEKALKEASERLAALEKNVAALESLIALKDKNLAELQKQAAAKPAPLEVPKPVSEVKPQEQAAQPVKAGGPVAVVPEKPVEAPVVEQPPVKLEEPKPEPVSEVVPEPAPQPEPTPVEPPKPQKPIPPPPPVAPVEEPGFVDGLLGNQLLLAGGGGAAILALIAAYVLRRRRDSQVEKPLDLSSTLSPHSQSLTANSVFRSTGGQSVDTSHTPAQTDFSQAGPGSIDTDEVDPVAEADVYMAYGRDAQAEEILLEAKQKDPTRYAIHLKLLEIYSNRKDLTQFEALASDLYSETAGVGADWEKAAAMGRSLDSENPLYGGSAQSAPLAFDADATVIVTSSVKSTVTLPGELSQMAELASQAGQPEAAESTPQEDLTSLDFDLGMGAEEPAPMPEITAAAPEVPVAPEESAEIPALDFDLMTMDSSASSSATEVDVDSTVVGFEVGLSESAVLAQEELKEDAAGLDFDLGFDSGATEIAPVAQATTQGDSADVPSKGLVEDDGVEFDVSLAESTFLGRSMPEDVPSFDMASIDLDLNSPALDTNETMVSSGTEPKVSQDQSIESDLVSTAVNNDFAIEQAETMLNPQFGVEPDLIPEQDFSMAQAATEVNPQFGNEEEVSPEFDISANEEVATKLDLAKAYEEMGDFEGARELLQEVLNEGDASQKEKAQAILAKIGD